MSSLMHHGVKAQRLSRNEKGIRDVYRSLSDLGLHVDRLKKRPKVG